MPDAIKVEGLRKRYGAVTALDGISFGVKKGEIFGLLGPNGAGKTTALECLEGLRVPDGGTASILGVDPVRESSRLSGLIGVQLQNASLPATIKVREALYLFSAYHRVDPPLHLLERVQLGKKIEAEYHSLSTGQQRRLALVLALAHRPPVLFLDEPTAGLDVGSRAELHRMIRELKEEGTTIILSTHDMAEAEEMTDRVAILLRGRIAATGTPRELTAAGSGLTRISVRTVNNSARSAVFPAVARQIYSDEYIIYYSSHIGPTVSAIIDHINREGDTLVDLRVERPSLEERFLELTSREGEAR